METLSRKSAYVSMLNFLEEYYRLTNSEDIGILLGSMAINEADGLPMDPGVWQDWSEAVLKALSA